MTVCLFVGELYDQIHKRKQMDVQDARFYAAEIVLMLQRLRQEKASSAHSLLCCLTCVAAYSPNLHCYSVQHKKQTVSSCMILATGMNRNHMTTMDHNLPKTSKLSMPLKQPVRATAAAYGFAGHPPRSQT